MLSVNQLWQVATLCCFSVFLYAEDIIVEMSSANIADSVVIQHIALGSCFAPQIDSDIWSAIAEYNPDIFLYLGDNVYQSEETNDLSLPHLREAYKLLAAVPAFTSFRHKTTILPTWDDHDFGMNDAGASWPAKYESEKLFEQVWAIPESDPRRSRDGIYFSRTFGTPGQRVQIIMLDTRFFRSDIKKIKTSHGVKKYQPDLLQSSTMLGEAQWQWLGEELKAPADIRMLVSSVQVLPGNGDFEGWYLFPKERERLLTLLNDINGLILLSGDKHYSAFYQIAKETGTPLLELISSSLNLPITGKRRTALETSMINFQLKDGVFDKNFSTINIDWSKRQMVLAIRSGDNKILQQQLVKIPGK